MFAIICAGNQQFKVSPGDVIRVPYLAGKKSKTTLKMKVLALQEGSDFFFSSAELKAASVKAVILGKELGAKNLVFKKKRRKGYRKTKGHRQAFTTLRITEIKKSSDKTASLKQTNVTEPQKAEGKTVKGEQTGNKNQDREKGPIRRVQSKTSAK